MKYRVLVTLFSLALLSATPAFAEPTLQQVYQAADSGHLREAQTMMDQVLREHPKSAKAHYVEAELLAKQGNVAGARSELATAEQLQPGLPFAKPDAVRELKTRVAMPAVSPMPHVAGTSAHAAFPWGLALVGILLVAAIVFFRRRHRPVVIPAQGSPYRGYGGEPYVGPTGPAPMPGGAGSGILGSLATGAAVGAGVVAGEALMHRMLDGGRSSEVREPPASLAPDTSWDDTSGYDMGGNDFGVGDASSWDDSGGSDWS